MASTLVDLLEGLRKSAELSATSWNHRERTGNVDALIEMLSIVEACRLRRSHLDNAQPECRRRSVVRTYRRHSAIPGIEDRRILLIESQ